MARRTPAAVAAEMACSPERPPNSTRTRGLRGAPVGCSSVDGTDRSGLWLDIADDPTGRLLARGRAPVRDPGNDPGGSGVGSAVEDTTLEAPAADDPDHSPGRTGPGSERTHPRVPDDRTAVRAR
ncbi:Uncharacterised protein [Mycobacteroides abscessus]|nr:Uncharacterised protein [Mycobacteroides abscessus]